MSRYASVQPVASAGPCFTPPPGLALPRPFAGPQAPGPAVFRRPMACDALLTGALIVPGARGGGDGRGRVDGQRPA